jgi:transposase InsO family protein
MATLPDPAPSLKPSVNAAVLLLARDVLRDTDTAPPWTAAQIVSLTGASRSQAYAMRERLLSSCAALHERPGRPERQPPSDRIIEDVLRAVRDYLFEHAGAVSLRDDRTRYSDGFTAFVVGLVAPGALAEGLAVAQLADATGVPHGTLKSWMWLPSSSTPGEDQGCPTPHEPGTASDVTSSDGDGSSTTDEDDGAGTAPTTDEDFDPASLAIDPDVATILFEYPRWCGDFTSFVEHLRKHHRLRHGMTFVSTVLQAVGLRRPKPRGGPKMAPWSRDTFRRLFPGAQWLGDGTELAITVAGQPCVFNLEAVLDVHTNAVTGIDVSDVENAQALLAAFGHGIDTTGAPPMALSVDNKPCNHSPLVHDSIAPTDVVASTPARGQAKAPLEGAFGLFEQTAPPLLVDGDTPRELARSMLALVVTVWAWARNGRPRRRLGGRSPASVYLTHRATPQEVQQARLWIAELKRRAEQCRDTAERRADPVRRQLIRETLQRHGIDDPGENLELAIASFGMEAILRGIATFDAKIACGTLPPGADPGRYFGGIVRETDARLELERIADSLLALRLRHRELTLNPFEQILETLRTQHDPAALPAVLVGRALDARANIDARFFTHAAADALIALPPEQRTRILPTLLRLVYGRFRAPKQRRADIIAALTDAATVIAPAA